MKRIPIALVAIVIILFAYLIVSRSSTFKGVTQTPQQATSTISSNEVSFYCTEDKTITATFGDKDATFSLSDGRRLTLPHAVSGSGIRYESITTPRVAFISKGADAFLTESGRATYNDCLAGSRSSQGNGYIFTDESKSFTLVYPATLSLSGGGIGYTQNWMQGATTSGLLLAVVHMSASFDPNSNLSDSRFTIGTSADPQAIKDCLIQANGSSTKSEKVTINGTSYTKIMFSDAGAGNFYDTTSYRTLRNGQCYVMEYTIHSTNIGNYPPGQVHTFDMGRVRGVFEAIAQSYTFI